MKQKQISTIKRVLRLFHTVKYLRLKQIYYRVYYKLYRLPLRRSIKVKVGSLRPWKEAWFSPPIPAPCFTASGEVIIFGETALLDNPLLWNDSAYSKIWLYNVHYFDWLNGCDADSTVELCNTLIERWINENPPYKGHGWEPYCLSLRIVNFIKWFSRKPELLTLEKKNSLALQVEALYKQLEYHILGNHLFVNGKALVFAGTYFEGSSAERYLKKGLEIIDQEINEQFLDDGGHFERSPMYHSILLWDLCDLVNLAKRTDIISLQQRLGHWTLLIRKAWYWLNCMLHPDRNIAFFNDAAFGIAPAHDKIIDYLYQLDIRGLSEDKFKTDQLTLNWLQYSGYCVVAFENVFKGILDIAKIGPDYQPGHAHADTLSFELSIHGQRFLVNSGISQYGESAQRHYERSTKAHNTVTINDESSSEVWAGFRVARRANPQEISINEQEYYVLVAAAHDGFRRLPAKPIHKREWHFSKQYLRIKDSITVNACDAESRLYFHPDVKITILEAALIQCTLPTQHKVLIKIQGASRVTVEPSAWHQTFGHSLENQCLVCQFTTNNLITTIEW